MKVYISGPMTNMPDYNRPAFRTWAKFLEAQGHEVYNPASLELTEDASWSDYMRHQIPKLCECEALFIMKCPVNVLSRGMYIERLVAEAIGLQIMSAPINGAQVRS